MYLPAHKYSTTTEFFIPEKMHNIDTKNMKNALGGFMQELDRYLGEDPGIYCFSLRFCVSSVRKTMRRDHLPEDLRR